MSRRPSRKPSEDQCRRVHSLLGELDASGPFAMYWECTFCDRVCGLIDRPPQRHLCKETPVACPHLEDSITADNFARMYAPPSICPTCGRCPTCGQGGGEGTYTPKQEGFWTSPEFPFFGPIGIEYTYTPVPPNRDDLARQTTAGDPK